MIDCDMSAVVPFPRALRTTLGAIVPFRDDDILVSASVRISFVWYFIFHNHFCTCHVAIMYFFTRTRTHTHTHTHTHDPGKQQIICTCSSHQDFIFSQLSSLS